MFDYYKDLVIVSLVVLNALVIHLWWVRRKMCRALILWMMDHGIVPTRDQMREYALKLKREGRCNRG